MKNSIENVDDKEQRLLYLVSLINWDYKFSEKELLEIIRKKGDKSDVRRCFFIKSLETFVWRDLVELWGIEECNELYDEKTRRGLFRKELRRIYDDVFYLLRTKTLPRTELSPEELEDLKSAILFNRRNRLENRVF